MTARTSQSWRSFAWASLAIVLGLGMFIGGLRDATATEPSCGGSTMEQDELCHHWDPDLGFDSGYDVAAEDQLRSKRTIGWVVAVIGAGLLVGAGITLRRWSERGELPWQPPRAPMATTSRSAPGAAPGTSRPGGQDPMRPIILRRQKRGIMLTADQEGIGVRRRPPLARESTRWRTGVWLSWDQIASLEFDSDRYDSPIALYAVLWSAGPREHIIDAQRFSRSAWERLASRVLALSGGSVALDLTGLDDPGPDRFT